MAKTGRQLAVTKADEKRPKTKGSRDEEVEESESDEEDGTQTYAVDGVVYLTYNDMVEAKRERNRRVLAKSGLLEMSASLTAEKPKQATQRGIARKRKAAEKKQVLPRRKSSRLAGAEAEGIYVDNESGGRFTIGGATPATTSAGNETSAIPQEPELFKNRINDGSDLSIKAAVELLDPKWIQDDSTENATQFISSLSMATVQKKAASSPTSVIQSLVHNINALSVDDEQNVAKVTPDRIYSVAAHPSSDKLVVCAGDKQGYVGLWNVDDNTEGGEVHLFRVHHRPVCCLSWTPSGDSLLSASYDGSVRWLDVESHTFQQIFATYDDSVVYRDQLGRGLDQGDKYWVQYVCPDHRSASDKCLFLSTSYGTALHVDLRIGKGKITFHEVLSEKKINSLSLHSNGNVVASAGLDTTVKLWDIRQFQSNRKGKGQIPLSTQEAGKSVNSAFFSPSGSTLLSTTMSNTLDITRDAHLASHTMLKPTRRVRHDNRTGRWLSTFMAQWHPSLDIFCVGSMRKPREIEIFDSEGNTLRAIQGEALTAVASRCCFHPCRDSKLVVIGGNSSGRVTVIR